jgi:hypothetical protein
MDPTGWLQSLGLDRYAAAFRENEIDETVLPQLTAEDLKDIGVGPVGHRRKLLDACSKTISATQIDVPPSAVSMNSPSCFSYCAFGSSRGCLGTTSAAGGHNAKALSKPRAASTLSGMR